MKGDAIVSFRLLAFLAVGVFAAAIASSQATAQSDAPQESPEFAIQGEYVGRLSRPVWGRCDVGVQVVALGKGEFSARLYYGGLPGRGAILGVSETWTGRQTDDGVVLWSGGRAMRVNSPYGWIYSEQGQVEASLTKIERRSPTLGLRPPRGAIVLFDGEPHQLENAKVEEGLLQVGAVTAFPVNDFRLHVEFRTPFMPSARDQGRGNSGVYIQRRYEVQILDSFGLEGKFNECGSLYRQTPPDLNMTLPPLTWQTYDIEFTAARFDSAGNKICPARITVFHNGVAVHFQREIAAKTGAGQPEAANPLPILFQNHRDKVEFRNIWIELL